MYRQTTAFHEALDIVGALPEYQQEHLIEIIRRRLLASRRHQLEDNVREARKEYARGEVRKGTADDLMREVSE